MFAFTAAGAIASKAMTGTCNRCGGQLAQADSYCAGCGSPQLFYANGEDMPENTGSGQSSPVRGSCMKRAITAAMAMALPVGLLTSSVIPGLMGASLFWTIGGAIAGVALYRRWSPEGLLNGKLGFRIGVIIGVVAAALATALNAAVILFQRYALHAGDAMDKAFQASMEQGSRFASQLYHIPPEQVRQAMQFWLTPEGHAAAVLGVAIVGSAATVFFSALSGALAGRILSRRPATARNA